MTRLSLAAAGAAVVGLGASIASAIDYATTDPTFCAETGCATVRASAWSHPLGVPLPALGIAFFAVALGLAFVARPRLRRVWAIGGALVGAGLIALQATTIGAWCKLCLIADPAALVHAALVLAGASTLRVSWRALAIVPATAAVLGALALWTHAPTAPAATAQRTIAVATKGVTIVEIVDFECPFCRQMQARLEGAIADAQVPVTVVRKMLPLTMHPHARAAAIAWCCADAQGKGEAMAAALFAADPETLTPAGCEDLAVAVGCDRERYRATLASAGERVDRDVAEARAAGDRSLPTLYIGDQRIVGATRSRAELAAMIRDAAI